jgi:Rps23 Pro-64 3,4-dihydroxylase Tpa1-like proline 4-hydroxylase
MEESVIENFSVDNKDITVIDDVFLMTERERIFCGLKNQLFHIGNQITTDPDSFLFITKPSEDFFDKDNPFFFEKIKQNLTKLYPNYNFSLKRAIGICWTKSNKIAIHGDWHVDDQITILYHANYDWNTDWGGENFFYNDNATQISQAVQYVPGRVIVFDSRIPHSVCTINEKKLRFTISLFLNKHPIQHENNYSRQSSCNQN